MRARNFEDQKAEITLRSGVEEVNEQLAIELSERLNSEMYDALEKWAADEFRSTNGQLEYIISDALKKAGRKPKERQETEDGKQ